MITDWINLTHIVVKGADRLYPKDISWAIKPGVNAIVGGTTLGKTTLVYALQFAIFGKMVVNTEERVEREFFANRLTKRSGKNLKDNPPTVMVEFNIGNSEFVVNRDLLSGLLIEVSLNGERIKGAIYESSLAKAFGISDDFESIKRLQGHLMFFGESRYLLAWENLIQHELINLLMSDHATYRRLEDLWNKAQSADSEARNISAQAVNWERALKNETDNQSSVDELQRRSDARELTGLRKDREKSLVVIRQGIAAEELLDASLNKKIGLAQIAFHRELAELEAAQSHDLDDSLIAAALASPNIASVRHALEEFYRSPDGRGCPCCGRSGIVASILNFAKEAAASARSGNCVICLKPIPPAKSTKNQATSSLTLETGLRAKVLQDLLFEREQCKSRIAELRLDEAKALEELAKARETELQNVQQNPALATDRLKITIDQMREREAAAKKERKKHLGDLNRELSKTNVVFSNMQSKIAKAFKKYATLYLDEPCDVKFIEEAELPGKRGPQIKAPHAAFFPIISGEIRPSAQALSDAQRSFVDLAFRMAVIDVWHQVTKKTVTMIVETPEGKLDIAYVERVALMIRTFGEQGHTLIITTNLNNDIFLPEIMANWPTAERSERMLSLLKFGNPKPVQLAQKPRFDAILKLVDGHAGKQ